ncbi:MAG: GTP pyrophosphokinase [Deltaproteobacteria bacterium]|nr:GTP pyrophosphokinase [Deltaproteobacteria bacterium]
MPDLSRAEQSQRIFSPVIITDDSGEEAVTDVPEAFLSSPEVNKLFQDWYEQQSDPDEANAFLKKLKLFSLSSPSILAVFLFMLFQKEDDLPDDIAQINQEGSVSDLTEAIQLFHRLLKVNKFPFRPKNKSQAELTIRMLLTVLGNVQLLTVYLVLQLQKLEQMNSLSQKDQESKAWTALHIHAPLAGRLGIFWIKAELEDHAFRYLEYESYQNLKKKIARKRSERSDSVEKISKKIQLMLNKAGITHEVQGRYKRFYSIFQKLDRVENDFERIQDLIAFRILVQKIDECYAALSFIHENWAPVKNRFKDYIANPKPNGYQSLHTTVVENKEEPSGNLRPVEIQIRTHEMHRMAEYGVAAHWLYKEKRHKTKILEAEQLEDSMTEKINENRDVNTIPVINLFSDKIYVITPAEEIIELPKLASPLDFAYSIHTEVGNRTIGAKANGSIISLDGALNSGDNVEILTSPRQEPRKEWLDYIKTRHARNKIKHALHEKNRDLRKKEGMEMLEKEFRSHSLNLNRLIREGRMEKESRQQNNQEFEHILFCIGEGSIRCDEIRRWFVEDSDTEHLSGNQESELLSEQDSTGKNKSVEAETRSLVIVDGMDNVLTRIARCCTPVRSQPILGYLTKERVITVHKEECSFLQKLSPERKVKVSWGNRR